VNVFRFIPGYEEEIYAAGKEPLLLLLISFLLSFGLTRLYTRLARRHGWGSGRLGATHVHHMVPGLVLVLVSGLIGFSTYSNPAVVDVAAFAFGAGAALVLDEFALVFHLEDVYWEDEGRQSVVATVLGAAVIVLMLVVTAPSGLHTETFSDRSRVAAVVYLGVNALFALICFLKGKPFVGLAAIFVPLVGLVGAVRLAHPGSPWAHVFYGEEKRQRARERFTRCLGQRVRNGLVALLGGFPHRPAPHA
jgi:chromate transport protein ChrA